MGKHDATAVWMHAEEREQEFTFSDPVLKERFVVFHLKDQPVSWSSVEDLSDLRLGGSIGYSYGSAFDQAIEDDLLSIEWVASTVLNFRRLLFDRIDAFPEEINVGYHILRRELDPEEASRITHHPRPLLENESFVLFPKTRPDTVQLAERFNDRLQAFRDSGRYDHYFKNPQYSLQPRQGQ